MDAIRTYDSIANRNRALGQYKRRGIIAKPFTLNRKDKRYKSQFVHALYIMAHGLIGK